MMKDSQRTAGSAGTALASVRHLATQLAGLQKGDFTARVDTQSLDPEVAKLAHLINIALEAVKNGTDNALQAQRRLAAAVSHELNNPLGVIQSTSDTLTRAAAKMAGASEGDNGVVNSKALIEGLCDGIQEAAARIEQVVARMQRFTNLGGAVIQDVDLNEILSDVIAMAGPQLEGPLKLKVDLEPVHPISCRPGQMTTVFASLLDNAIESAGERGFVAIRSCQQNGAVQIEISDDGPGLSAEQLNSIFEPVFRVVDQRIAAANWTLFSARHVIHEHGGEIRIDSEKSTGTEVTVTLPTGEQSAGSLRQGDSSAEPQTDRDSSTAVR